MNRIHILGRKNSGKTTLVVDLVHHFRALGYRVGTIKHTHHHHELDTPGKDSFRHRQAGAKAVGIVAPTMSAVFWPSSINGPGPSPKTEKGKLATGESRKGQLDQQLRATKQVEVREEVDDQTQQYEQFDSLMADCDLVLVEGDQQARAIKIEVWHQGLNERPLAESNASIALMVTNDLPPTRSTHRRDDLPALGRRLLELAKVTPAIERIAARQPLGEELIMKEKKQLEHLIEKIASPDSPVGMDAVYVHALILDKLQQLDERLERLEQAANTTRTLAD